MPRPLRLIPLGGIHHVTVRGNDRQVIFLDAADSRRYLAELDRCCQDWCCDLIAYALMTNHVHLVLQDHRGQLSQFMQVLNVRYTRYFNDRYDRVGQLYQGRFHASHVDRNEYLLEVTRYVHLNPVRAGLAERPEDYPWSSYRVYIDAESNSHRIQTELVCSLMSRDRFEHPRLYRQFVLDMTPEKFSAWERRLQRLQLVPGTFPALGSAWHLLRKF